MKSTRITFYKVGLNERNFAWDLTAFNNILAAGAYANAAGGVVVLSQPLAFGSVFNISFENYQTYKNATYLKIENTIDGTTETRFAFINNFLELANGNYSISYTLDDWANYILNEIAGNNYHIDGFIDYANVKVGMANANVGYFLSQPYFTGARQSHSDLKILNRAKMGTPGEFATVNADATYLTGTALPNAKDICAVYFLNSINYNGAPSSRRSMFGTINDIDVENLSGDNITLNYIKTAERKIPRQNSNIVFRVFKYDALTDSYSAYSLVMTVDNQLQAVGGYDGEFDPTDLYAPNDATIQKIMYFEGWAPFETTAETGFDFKTFRRRTATGWETVSEYCLFNVNDSIKSYCADIGASVVNVEQVNETYHYYFGLWIPDFTPLMVSKTPKLISPILPNYSEFTPLVNYGQYLSESLYSNLSQFNSIKFKYLTAELTAPGMVLQGSTLLFAGLSGDGESCYLKLARTIGQDSYNKEFATGQNINYFDPTVLADFRTYKNAKITGAASIAATTAGALVSLGSSVATGNVAGMVGALSGGLSGVMGNIKALEGLTPAQQSPANGDQTLTIIGDLSAIYGEVIKTMLVLDKIEFKDAEENGVACFFDWKTYRDTQRCQAFNAIRCAAMEITGIPAQAARRIIETFMSGVTLWTSTDVGNKRQINYGIMN